MKLFSLDVPSIIAHKDLEMTKSQDSRLADLSKKYLARIDKIQEDIERSYGGEANCLWQAIITASLATVEHVAGRAGCVNENETDIASS